MHSRYLMKQYKSGGLADFTGPAWLDGTKSNPEVVLNAQDTQNFLQLRDILRQLSGSNITNNSIGDAYYNFDIQVDQLANDYDVNQLANQIKEIINRSSAYRNVNALSRVR